MTYKFFFFGLLLFSCKSPSNKNNEDFKNSFVLKKSSEIYYAKIYVKNCDDLSCQGKGVVEIFLKGKDKPVQTIKSKNLFTELDSHKKPKERNNQVYDGQSVILFGDYNFDGKEDLAIRSGNLSAYSGPSYDIYLYDSKKGQFIFNTEFTNLVTGNLGMFEIDLKRKRLKTFDKSGCCWHMTTEYTYIPEQRLIKVYVLEEDVNQAEQTVKVVEKNLVNEKWEETSKTYPVNDYYKE